MTGYAQFKWVSEKLVLEFARLGGHVLILRPGRLLGNTHNFRCPRDDFTVRLIASMLEMGVAPDLDAVGGKNWQIDLTPIDSCARLTHELSLLGTTGIRHIINNNTISFETIVTALGGGHIKRIPYRTWIQLVPGSAHLAPLSSLFHEPVSTADGRSIFEALLHMEPFRCSQYETTVPHVACHRFPSSTVRLLEEYLEANEDIFSRTK